MLEFNTSWIVVWYIFMLCPVWFDFVQPTKLTNSFLVSISCIILQSNKETPLQLWKECDFWPKKEPALLLEKKTNFQQFHHYRFNLVGWDDPPKLSLSSPVRRLQYLDEVHWPPPPPPKKTDFCGVLFLLLRQSQRIFSIQLAFMWSKI